MGVCSNNKLFQNCFLCNNPQEDNNILIINLDKNDDEKNKNKNFDNKNEIHKDYLIENNLNSKNQNDNNIIVFRIHSKYKSKALKSYINSKNNLKNKENIGTDKNKYKLANERFEKLIHFTNSNNNISITTNSIVK